MPLYEYKCGSCGKTFEVIQKFADEPLTVHAECGGEVVRLLSAPAFHLKGTGWYATDYKKSGSGGSAESKAESKSKEEAKPAAPAATTTETKTESHKPSTTS